MNGGVIPLGPHQLALAALLVVAAGAVSVALRLGIGKRLGVAAVRTVVQLGLLGLILERVFALDSPGLVVLLVVIMTLFAAREAVARSGRSYRGIRIDAWLVMAGTCFVVGGIVTQSVVGVRPWYDPQYVIPLLGMILGNSLNGISLCSRPFPGTSVGAAGGGGAAPRLRREPTGGLGGTPEAAVRTGMIPIINAMAAAGIVSLPGMMTGQILAGSPPIQAVAYQIVVMFMIAAATAIGAMAAAVAAGRRLVAPDGTLRLDRLNDR